MERSYISFMQKCGIRESFKMEFNGEQSRDTMFFAMEWIVLVGFISCQLSHLRLHVIVSKSFVSVSGAERLASSYWNQLQMAISLKAIICP